MVLYSWTCHGDDGTNKILDKFTGDASEDCYCDNEPMAYVGPNTDKPPPGFQPYAFWYTDDGCKASSGSDQCGGKGGPCLDVRNIWDNSNFFLCPM